MTGTHFQRKLGGYAIRTLKSYRRLCDADHGSAKVLSLYRLARAGDCTLRPSEKDLR